MRRFKVFLFAAALLIFGSSLHADEGMWLLPLLKKYNIKTMQELGLKLTAEDIYNANGTSLKDAIIIFGNGCTGEIVSQKGLILTNHHCGYSAIQQHSSVEHDYLKDGFWAKSFEEEIPTPGLTATFLVRMEDVTAQILAEISDNMPEAERSQAIQTAADSIAREAKGDTHYNTMVKSFYGGNQYFLLVYEVFTDVRMVGAPPSSIGKFGADTDNWMYPRHTGDFSLFRIYANKENKPADYAEDNVPYRPRKSLTVSLAGIDENDFAMILGFPGTTNRYMTSWEVRQTIDVVNKDRAHIRGVKQEVWQRHMQADPAVRIKYAAKYAQSSNYWKNAIGQSAALQRLGTIEEKQAEERQFANWVSQDAKRHARYGQALRRIEQSVEKLNKAEHIDMYFFEALYLGMEFNRLAFSFGNLELAIHNEDTATLNHLRRIAKDVLPEKHFKDYDANTDRETCKAMLKLFRQDIAEADQPDFFRYIDKKFRGNIDKFVDKLFEKSIFTDYERLVKFLEKPSLKALQKDLGHIVASSSRDFYFGSSSRDTEAKRELSRGQREYIAGRLEMLDGAASYPDANFTMRLTYGTVKGYAPRDAVSYRHYTTLQGAMEKEDPDSWEFQIPARLKHLYERKDYERYGRADGTMPLDFLSTNDITGGNSGSPVLNAKGHLIGLAFDGNWESLSGDIAFEHNLQRCINVDIRYVLFVIDKFAGCTRLIDEMQIVK